MQQTSIQAYSNKLPTIKNDQDRILFKMSKTAGLTYNEIAEKLNWKNPNKVSRRLLELVKKNKIKVIEVRKCNVAGSNCNSYIKISE